jgi:chemotaxis protein methyltransferase CheR
VIPGIHQRIQWGTVNLMSQQEVAAALPASVVFCRNVFIYFSAEAIARTIRLFSAGMSRPGYLFVGVSESLLRHTADFELQEIGGAFVYVQR